MMRWQNYRRAVEAYGDAIKAREVSTDESGHYLIAKLLNEQNHILATIAAALLGDKVVEEE